MRRGWDGAGPSHLAGWLFADLFLVLSLITLGLAVAVPDGDGEGPRPPDRIDTERGDQQDEEAREPGGIDPHFQKVSIDLGSGAMYRAPGADALREGDVRLILDAVDEEMRESSDGRRIGMVITFGRSSTAEITVARELAQDVNAMLLDERPGAFCGSNVGTRDFWYGGEADAVDIEIYYVNSCKAGATE